jgi:hypothetical protein
MPKSVALAADPSQLASLLLSYIPRYAPSSRLAIGAPQPRSSTDLAIRGPLLHDGQVRDELVGRRGGDAVEPFGDVLAVVHDDLA